MTAIGVSNVSVRYNGDSAVDRVSLAVAPGEWVALIGPNGAGKSSLLRAVAGTVPFTGEVALDGRPVSALRHRERARLVAVVPQQPVRPDGMSVLDYVLLGRTPHMGYLATETDADITAARAALSRLDAADLEPRLLHRLSGGEWQRVVLARALAQQSPVMVLDEPTAALDIGHQQQVLELVDGLRRGGAIAVLSALHDLTLAAQYADRLVLMDRGRVAADGPPRRVLTPEALTHFSGARVRVMMGPGGEVIVVPTRDGSQQA
jgi:iron complex transport system ATP-binding protein